MPHRDDIFSRFSVKEMAIFGSFARGDQNSDSDVDVLVDFTQPVGVEFIDLANFLETILKRKVDLVSRKGIQTKYLERIKNELEYV